MAGPASDGPRFASLSSGLLARKGGARPAMRRPSADNPHGVRPTDEDLGWNDSGDADSAGERGRVIAELPGDRGEARRLSLVQRQQRELAAEFSDKNEAEAREASPSRPADRPAAPVTGLRKAPPEAKTPPAEADDGSPATPARPDRVLTSPAAAAAVRPALREVAAKLKKRAEAGGKTNAAFTLRLDAERHLRLRLACAAYNISAQQLVTEALDAVLETLPEVEPLAVCVNSR